MSKDPVNKKLMEALESLPLPLELRSRIYRHSQDAWIEEIASLMGELYEIFVKLAFLQPEQVEHPPHDDINMDLAMEMGLSADALLLIQKLPYVVDYEGFRHWQEENTFFPQAGVFLDYRQGQDQRQSRDPHYTDVDSKDESIGWGDKDGRYMRPCMRSRRLIYIDSEDVHSIDPNAKDDFDEESIPEGGGPASEFLHELIQHFNKLDLLPGPVTTESYEFHHRKRIYLEKGWPDDYDRAACSKALDAFKQQERSDYHVEAPLREIESVQERMEGMDNGDEKRKKEFQQELIQAKEDAKKVPENVMKRREERAQKYDAFQPYRWT